MADEAPVSESPAPAPAAARNCRNHPDVAAARFCQQCGTPLCAACVRQSPVRQGTFCAACADALEAAWTEAHREPGATLSPPVAGARCAFHVDRGAAETCGRCGNFLCAACAIPSPWDEATYCKDCLARLEAEGGGGRIPWEERKPSFLSRYWRTVNQVLFAPSDFFRRMPSRGYLPAITFQYHTMLYMVPLMILVMWLLLPRGFGMEMAKSKVLGQVALIFGLFAIIAPIVQFISSGWLHLHLYLFGGRAGFEATYRLSSYLAGMAFPYLLLQFLVLATRSRVLALILLIALAVWAVALAAIAASRAQRMNGGMAFLAVLLAAAEWYLLWTYVVTPAILGRARMGASPFL